MKKQLLSIFAALTVSSVVAQTPSPSWTIAQNANFSITTAGHRFIDAVDQNVVWLSGYDGTNATANYNWWSRTINGGNTFTSGSIFSDTSSYSLGNMEGIDGNTAWVSAFQRSLPYSQSDPGGGVIYRTTNGGTTWTNMTAPGMFTNTTTSFLNWVSFLTPQVGIVNGDPVNGGYELWKTTNGGTSWTQIPAASIPTPLANEFSIVDLYSKQGTNNLWFGTNKGRIYRTNDQGTTWNVSALPSSPNSTVTEICFTDANHGILYASSGAPTAINSMFNTTDGGVTWNLIHNNVDQAYSATNFIGRNELSAIPGTGYFASVDNANAFLSYSMDNGVTWVDWGSSGIPYVSIDMVDGHTGWVGGFSDALTPSVNGLFKYNGITFNSAFTVPQYVCKGVSDVTITPTNGSSASTALTFSWSGSSGVIFSSTTATAPVITFSANGTYTVSLAATNIDGTNISSHVVTVLTCAVPSTSFSLPATACNILNVALTSTTTGAPVPTRVITTSPNTSVTIAQSSSNNNNYTIKFADPGTYTVTLTASSAAGVSTHTQVINIQQCLPSVDFTVPTEGCRMDSIIAVNTTTANALAGSISYTWSIVPSQPSFTIAGSSDRGFIMSNSTFTYPRLFTVTLKAKNTTTTSSISHTFNIGTCVNGISENGALAGLSLYPNPAHESVNVILPVSQNDYTIKLVNILGSVVYEEKVKGTKENTTINLANKAKGVYFLNVETNGEKVMKKIIVE